MNRIGLLSAIARTIGAITLNPEHWLWRLAKRISIPPPRTLRVRWIRYRRVSDDASDFSGLVSRFDVMDGPQEHGVYLKWTVRLRAGTEADLERLDSAHRDTVKCSLTNSVQKPPGLVTLLFPPSPLITGQSLVPIGASRAVTDALFAGPSPESCAIYQCGFTDIS